MTDVVYTVGHSTHSIDKFISLLEGAGIGAVGDVRSRPYSRMNPQFNREALKKALNEHGIVYVFLGKELGARTEDQTCYRGGRVQFDLLASTDLFKQGIARVREGSAKYKLALMCAEKEPLDCHRTILVARALIEQGLDVQHILENGTAEAHDHAIERLIEKLRVPTDDMFRPKQSVVSEAYALQGKEIAYQEESPEGTRAESGIEQRIAGAGR